MSHSESNMVWYLRLAHESWCRKQIMPSDRFLILAGAAATESGWASIAAACQNVLREHQPRHQLCQFPDFAHALRDADFRTFIEQLRRRCPPETAEHLVATSGAPGPANDDLERWALSVIQDCSSESNGSEPHSRD
ncbi:MAG: hypothetical protein KF777_03935 [Planctomycetaceae bacterium]|nr:hypothetical protein [Planctomycetaceae bacterium]